MPPVWLGVPGKHNVANAMAVLLTGLDLGAPYDAMARSLEQFTGARRRFQIKGVVDGIAVVDDYAHHPTEVKATLEAARDRIGRNKNKRVICVFQPHRYSRTKSHAAEFGGAFSNADLVILTDVYAAGEDPIEGVSGKLIHDQVARRNHREIHYVENWRNVASMLVPRLHSGDMVFTMGAGDIWKLGDQLLEELKRRAC
jgi:UDP-N-acetylmuramate--alanine ligase